MKQQNNDSQKDLPIIKIVVIGQSGVGKSNIISRFAYDKFYIGNNATIGIQFYSKTIIIDNQQFTLQVWDTAGQERFRSINRSFYRNAHGAVVAFSLGDHKSFNNLPKWIQQLRQNVNDKIVLLLAGNKCDLKQQKVLVDDAAQFAKKQKMAYLQTSAALNINIDKIFEMITNKVYLINKDKLSQKTSKTKQQVLFSIHEVRKQTRNRQNKQKCCT